MRLFSLYLRGIYTYAKKKKNAKGERVPDAQCLKDYVEIKSTKPIPNGGYALFSSLGEELTENNYMGLFQSIWRSSVKSVYASSINNTVEYQKHFESCKFDSPNPDAYKLPKLKKYLVKN